MSSAVSAFVEANKDFVLKLKFIGDDATSQIRRVKLPRIVDGQGVVSYSELVGLAISLVIPENPKDANDFVVKLTYQDVDNDTVVVGSSEELLDAIDQFSEQRVLRMTAEVKPCQPAETPQQPNRARASPESRPQAAEKRPDNAPGTTKRSLQPTPVLQTVVENVVNIILNAAVSLNGHGHESAPGSPAAAPPTPSYTPEGVLAETAEETPAASQAPESNVAEAPKREPKSPPGAKCSVKKASCVAAKPKASTTVQPPAKDKTDDVPFIHGRHTCDGCLTTPIIGKRYKACNMSDYDLCENCFSNYKGDEIKFEPAELERDRHLQDRWRRRKFRMHQNRPGHRLVPPHLRGGRPRAPYPPAPFPQRTRCGPRGPRVLKATSHPADSSLAHHANGGQREDLAMKEAIRLSLKMSETSKTAASPVQATDAPAGSDDKGTRASLKEEKKAAAFKERKADEKKKKAASEESSEKVNLASVTSLKKPPVWAEAPEPSAPLEEELRSLSSIGSGNSHTSSDSVRRSTESVAEVKEESDAATQTDYKEVKVPTDASFASGVSNIKTDSSQAGLVEDSFTSAAAGNGDVADMLGETLDKCAKAIDAMVLELDRTPSSDDSQASGVSSYVGVEDTKTDTENAEKGTSVAEETEGATILEPNGDGNPTENEEVAERTAEGDWQVVTEENQISDDEQLARAAQMIGSALFNSDMKSSEEVTSGAAESDAISFASSVPTDVRSVTSGSQVTPAQLERWQDQLNQLHKMGIYDDARCVEIIERLSAANIGCDNDDEIGLNQIVHELYEN